ncbi:DUF2197 domain-containing protein [Dehalobacterium formicoaceticum]|uniref:YlaI family protein n=1 Tax=Dehalobacterium formicoaceticum TaxID=51515 RepID=A0ABT1Y5Z4_9FIRM|nr:DUF2197 domain-containing protein [Dehalobacterium formicoaceticum]MCR6546303.1 YlaI family protein [Dehalobacterium formicoaceticum]
MQVKCSLCGKVEDITKIHKDYSKLAKNQETPYFCQRCSMRVKHQAKCAQDMPKPI